MKHAQHVENPGETPGGRPGTIYKGVVAHEAMTSMGIVTWPEVLYYIIYSTMMSAEERPPVNALVRSRRKRVRRVTNPWHYWCHGKCRVRSVRSLPGGLESSWRERAGNPLCFDPVISRERNLGTKRRAVSNRPDTRQQKIMELADQTLPRRCGGQPPRRESPRRCRREI